MRAFALWTIRLLRFCSKIRRAAAELTRSLRRSREMTLLCSPKVTQHHQRAGAAFLARQERIMPVCKHRCERSAARVNDRTLHHSVMSATDQGATAAARAGLLPR